MKEVKYIARMVPDRGLKHKSKTRYLWKDKRSGYVGFGPPGTDNIPEPQFLCVCEEALPSLGDNLVCLKKETKDYGIFCKATEEFLTSVVEGDGWTKVIACGGSERDYLYGITEQSILHWIDLGCPEHIALKTENMPVSHDVIIGRDKLNNFRHTSRLEIRGNCVSIDRAVSPPDTKMPHSYDLTEVLVNGTGEDVLQRVAAIVSNHSEPQGPGDGMVDLSEPIGKFILDQKDISAVHTDEGDYYHYADVCKLLNRQSEKILKAAKVTRVEVIDHSCKAGSLGYGRAYVKNGAKSVELSYQDNDRTLKVFVK